MHHRSKFVSIFAILALLLGNAVGWLHVHQHSGGRCEHIVVGEHHSHAGGCCESSPQAAQATPVALRNSEAADGDDWPLPHESDGCAICQHFMTCQDNAVALVVPLFCAACRPIENALALDQVWRDNFADSVHFLRGPPVV